ncbi:MAG: hypothetical protein LDLANPLL_02330 [Turneriella sp.]|nr:hypothetical protein [Turneriella sp.]
MAKITFGVEAEEIMVVRNYSSIFFVAVVPLFFSCMQMEKITLEYINAPVSLEIEKISANTYELQFYSDNREGNFSGYGVFTGNTFSEVALSGDLLPIATTAAQGFCSTGTQALYATRIKIRVGPQSSSDALCNLTSLSLISGTYVGLRARVERQEKAWSAAAIVLVP